MVTTERVALDEALERACERKRVNFIDDYDLRTKPALIWQCWPTDALVLDVTDDKLLEAMRDGGGPTANDDWWQGFRRGSRPSLVFDGLASATDHGGEGWATEVHVDGHLAAGVWAFPELGSSSATPGPGVADFYVDAFRDFTYLAGRVCEGMGYSGLIYLTCTVLQADRLPLIGHRDQILAPAPKRKTLRWPITTVKATETPKAGAAMAAQFMRAYGKSATRR